MERSSPSPNSKDVALAALYGRRAELLRHLADLDLEIAGVLGGSGPSLAKSPRREDLDSPPGENDEDLLTVPEAAGILRLSPKSVYKLVDEGRLPVVRMSARRLRLRRASLLAWLERQEDAPRKRGFR